MAQKKLLRFREIGTFSNVLQYPEDIAGKWSEFFGNQNPLNLELACGRGEYTIGLANLYKDQNFIGIDIKGNRLWVGAKKALANGLPNAAFLRTQIDKIAQYFDPAEVSGIWITFPDPHLRMSKARKRLTHPKFIRLYQKFLRPGGIIHLKTDSRDLYEFTKTVIELYELPLIKDLVDVYSGQDLPAEFNIKTHYEGLNISGSNQIFYLAFSLPVEIDVNDEKLDSLVKSSPASVIPSVASVIPSVASVISSVAEGSLEMESVIVMKSLSQARDDEKRNDDDQDDQQDFYFEPSGLMVFTANYHLKKGYCCGNGCRHCPYQYLGVPEPTRSKLLSLRKNG